MDNNGVVQSDVSELTPENNAAAETIIAELRAELEASQPAKKRTKKPKGERFSLEEGMRVEIWEVTVTAPDGTVKTSVVPAITEKGAIKRATEDLFKGYMFKAVMR